jgi:hypothetical protein
LNFRKRYTAHGSGLCLRPVFQFETVDSFEMLHVVGDQDEIMSQRVGRKHQFKIIERGAGFFKIGL